MPVWIFGVAFVQALPSNTVDLVTSSSFFADLTDVTLADEDTNSILTDNANRAIEGDVAM